MIFGGEIIKIFFNLMKVKNEMILDFFNQKNLNIAIFCQWFLKYKKRKNRVFIYLLKKPRKYIKL